MECGRVDREPQRRSLPCRGARVDASREEGRLLCDQRVLVVVAAEIELGAARLDAEAGVRVGPELLEDVDLDVDARQTLVGEDRVLTGPEPGVTRDAIPIDWTYTAPDGSIANSLSPSEW